MRNSNYQEFLEFAIDNEKEAAALYEKYAGIVASAAQKKLLQEMAAMERAHEQKLKELARSGMLNLLDGKSTPDLHISDYLVEVEIKQNSPLEDVFVYAMKAEQKAHELYSMLAEKADDPAIQELFNRLANEEKKHKYSLESEYDKGILTEN
jgi:rubrerythrin